MVFQYKSAASTLQIICCLSVFSSSRAYQNALRVRVVPNPSRTDTSHLLPLRLSSKLAYSKGEGMYPTTNQRSFSLEDSFPLGIIPPMAQSILDKTGGLEISTKLEDDIEDDTIPIPVVDMIDDGVAFDDIGSSSKASTTRTRTRTGIFETRKKGSMSKRLVRILNGAAKAQEGKIAKFPLIVAVSMVTMGLVPPSQILFVAFFSGYLMGLNLLASSPQEDDLNLNSLKPVLPNLPPQGHIPDIMMNPLGATLTESASYHNWLRIGASLGYVLPIFAAGFYKQTDQLYLASRAATSVFLISCQIVTESIAKRFLLPLPIRILVPMVYNAMRIGPLYDWISLGWNDMALWGRALAVGNFLYWTSNLFLFLIPVASLRYLRSHFFCVEAEEVVLREGF